MNHVSQVVRLSAACLVVALMLPGSSWAQKKTRDPIAETQAIVGHVEEAMGKTKEWLAKIDDILERSSNLVAASDKISAATKAKFFERAAAAQRNVSWGIGYLDDMETSFKNAKKPLELLGQVNVFAKEVNALDLGGGSTLGKALYVFSEGLTLVGEVPGVSELPIVSFLEGYGKATKSMISALTRLKKAFEDIVGKDIVGRDTGTTTYPEHNAAFFKQYPELWRAATYFVAGPSFAYRSEDTVPGGPWIILWDDRPSLKLWYVEKRSVDVTGVYNDNLLLGRTLDARELHKLLRYPTYEKRQEFKTTGKRIVDHMNKYVLYSTVPSTSATTLPTHKEKLFVARFAYDETFQPKVWARMKEVFDYLCKNNPKEAAGVKKLTQSWGYAAAKDWSCGSSACVTTFVGKFDFPGVPGVGSGYVPRKSEHVACKVEARITQAGEVRLKVVALEIRHDPAPATPAYVGYVRSAHATFVLDRAEIVGHGAHLILRGRAKVVTDLYEKSTGKLIWGGESTVYARSLELGSGADMHASLDWKACPDIAGLEKLIVGPGVEATVKGTPRPVETVSGAFAGFWHVSMYPSATTPPTAPVTWKITVAGSDAIAWEKVSGSWREYCRGPLSSAGRVWNAERRVGMTLVQRFDNVRLSADGKRFEGSWSGAAPHGYPFVGKRASGDGDPPMPPTPETKEVTLSRTNPHARASVRAGATLKVNVEIAGGTGYKLRLGALPFGVSMVRGPNTEPAGSGKLGAGSVTRYEFHVTTSAPKSFRIAIQLYRPPGGRAEVEYDVTVTVSRPSLGPLESSAPLSDDAEPGPAAEAMSDDADPLSSPEPQVFKGLLYVKHGRVGTRSEGPDYFLQTLKADYRLMYKERTLWEPDYHLEFFNRRMVEIRGRLSDNTIQVVSIMMITNPRIPEK